MGPRYRLFLILWVRQFRLVDRAIKLINFFNFPLSAQIGFSDQGKILLQDHYSIKIGQTLTEMGKSIHNLSTRLQIRALNCLEILFRGDAQNNRVK